MSVPRLIPFSLLALGMSVSAAVFPDPANLPALPAPPDPLVASDGQRITTAKDWNEKRRPELQAMVQQYEYGFLPPAPAKVSGKVLFEDPKAFGGKATMREVELTWGTSDAPIHLLLVTPNQREKPAAVFLGLNFTGNHTVVAEPRVQLPAVWMSGQGIGADHRAREADRGKSVDTWDIEQTIDRGYAVATFFNGDVVPDEPTLAEAALAKLRASGNAERSATDAGTIAAWAWCLMRAVDYLVTNPDVDAKRIALVGHSRNGKTALLAGAFDERIAMVIPSQAGCGGTAPVRMDPELAKPQANGRPTAETVAVINHNFPHWFCGNFKAFDTAPEKLPFDQDSVIALCAPRPVLVSCAVEDRWANPAGQFDMLRSADPAYRLVAGDGIGSAEAPAVGQLLNSRLGYFIRPGKHSMNKEDWSAWLDYADRWLK